MPRIPLEQEPAWKRQRGGAYDGGFDVGERDAALFALRHLAESEALFEERAQALTTDSVAGAATGSAGEVFGASQALLAAFDRHRDAVAQLAPAAARPRLKEGFAAQREALLARGAQIDEAGAGERRIADLNAALAGQARLLQASPERLDEVLEASRRTIALAGLKPEVEAAHLAEVQHLLADRAASALIARDPVAAKAQLEAGAFDHLLSAEAKAAHLADARVEVRRRTSEAERRRRELAVTGRATARVAVETEREALRRTGRRSGLIGDKELRALLPEDGAALIAELEREQELYVARQAVAATTVAEDEELLMRAGPDAASAAAATSAEVLQQATAEKRRSLAADPVAHVAEWVMRELGEIDDAGAEPLDPMHRTRLRVTLSDEVQRHLGIEMPRLLTNAEARDLVAQIAARSAAHAPVQFAGVSGQGITRHPRFGFAPGRNLPGLPPPPGRLTEEQTRALWEVIRQLGQNADGNVRRWGESLRDLFSLDSAADGTDPDERELD